MNTRKIVNTDSLNELAESIKSVGVLQPITVRKAAKKGFFEIVAGERRFHACEHIGCFELPCIIKSLTDTQAMEVMITENLQREDIHPLEESEAFMRLNSPTCNVFDIAPRFGKSITYVKGRIRLDDLSPVFKELFRLDVINISIALEIAGMNSSAQDKIFENYYKNHEEPHWNAPTLVSVQHFIERNLTARLSEVNFDIQDTELIPSAGACTACQNNSAMKFTLFPEELKTGLCLNVSCLKSKMSRQLENQVKQIIDLEPETFIGTDGYLREADKLAYDNLTEQDVKVFEFGYTTGYRLLREPGLPDGPKAEEFELGVKDEDYIEQMESYQVEMDEYKAELLEYNKSIQSDKVSKVFMLSGNNKGRFSYFIPNGNVPVTESNPETKDRHDRVKVLHDKLKRNEELEFEKGYLGVRDMIKESDYASLDTPITATETRAFLFEITGHYLSRELKLNSIDSFIELAEIPMIIYDKVALMIFRNWLKNQLHTGAPVGEPVKAQNLIDIAQEYYPKKTQAIVDAVKEKYLKRNESIRVKIEEITLTNELTEST